MQWNTNTLCVPVNVFYGSTEQTLSVTTLNVLSKQFAKAWRLYLKPLTITLHITVDIIHFQALYCTDWCISWLNLCLGLEKCSCSFWLKFSPAICFGLNESEGVCLDWGQWRRANASCGITVCRWKGQFKRDLFLLMEENKIWLCHFFWLLEMPLGIFTFHWLHT